MKIKERQKLEAHTAIKTDHFQATKWVEELYETLLNDYDEVGCNGEELILLRDDRMKLEDTARVRRFCKSSFLEVPFRK